MTSPVFVITNNGNAAVNATILGGLRVEIASFAVGSDATTPATSLDSSLAGNLLYSAVPISYGWLDANTVSIRLEIPANEGPFEFGEVALYMPDGTMFARASFGALQYKYSSTVSGLPNIWRMTAILRFSQAPALFNIHTSSQNRILEVGHFGLINSPGTTFGSPNAVIVQENTPYGDSVFMWAASPTRWSISKYTLVGQIVLNAPSTLTTLPSPDWASYSSPATGTYLVQTLSGDVRSVLSMDSVSATTTQDLNVLPTGSVLDLYRADIGSVQTTIVPTSHFNTLTSMFNTQWATPTGTNELDSRGWGQTPVALVTPGAEPSAVQWLELTSSVKRAAQMLDLPDAFDINGMITDWSGNYFGYLSKFTALTNTLNSIVSAKPGMPHLSKTDVAVQNTTTHNGTWDTMHYDVEVTFTSADHMRAFFNAGGWVGFEPEIQPDNYVQRTQQIELEELDLIRVTATTSESTGMKNYVMREGDGLITDGGNSGFYGLTNVPRRLWSYTILSASGTGSTQYDGTIRFHVDAYLSAVNKVVVVFTVEDNSDPAFVLDSEGGSPFFRIQCVTGRPDPALLLSPPIAQPSVVVLASSTW